MKKYLHAILFIFLPGIIAAGCYINVLIPWEDGNIPYFFSGQFTEQEVLTVEAAMDEWEAACGVTFEEVLPNSYAYEIIKTGRSNTWASSIGENNVYNHMFYGTGTDAYSHVLHELGHCLGLLHEHQRPDRDDFVTIVWNKIWPEYAFNFEIRNNPLLVEENYAYDYYSVMHYNSRGFSIDGSETIIPVDPEIEIIRADHLTADDKAKCSEIYSPLLEDEN
ncbi:MAG: hypothetical protein CVV44_12765 [Spirochaetae bacterium HGW-Spirochaetae-1]|jgi:hypothetical protein|nr:MAG: hypothetical protein CVV44_12765 [Spirochaetae bacterium HGW-Spirochaetae-1]